MKHLLIIISILLLSSPVIGQSSKCNRVQIKRLIDLKWSDSEIKEVCGNIQNLLNLKKIKSLKNVKNPKRISP